MNSDEKKQAATTFIHDVRGMTYAELNALIIGEVGESLSGFFIRYSASLMERKPGRVLENASVLMLMGYLIRANEEKTAPKSTTWAPIIGRA